MIDILLSTDLAGGSVILLWLLARRVSRDRLPAQWHYGILKAGLLLLLLPVRWCLARAAGLIHGLIPAAEAAQIIPHAPMPVASPLPNVPAVTALPAAPLFPSVPAPETALAPDLLQALTAVWLIGAVVVLVRKLWSFARFHRLVLRKNSPVSDPEVSGVLEECCRQLRLRQRVEVQTNPLIRTPIVTGVFRPAVVLPAEFLSGDELRCVFRHELTHIKHGDLLIRQISMLACILHWYDPLAYLLHKHIQLVSEQSCDARVSAALSRQERYAYGSVLLKLAASIADGSGKWAIPLSAKETLERRLYHMLHPVILNGWKRIAAVAAAFVILICGAAAAFAISGQSADETAQGPAGQETLSTDGTTAPEPEPPLEPDSVPVHVFPAATPKPLEAVDVPDVPEPAEAPATPKAPPIPETTLMPEAPALPAEPDTPSDVQTLTVPEGHIFSRDDPIELWAACALRGDTDLILSRGGTLLPDDEWTSYSLSDNVPIKLFATKDSTSLVMYAFPEYAVGNIEVLNPDTIAIEYALSLPDGVYPVNSRGESYGKDPLAWYVGYNPVLVEAWGTNGENGYIIESEINQLPQLPADECPHEFMVPLYDEEHNVIGEFSVGHSPIVHMQGQMTLEEAREALKAIANGNHEDSHHDEPEEYSEKSHHKDTHH